MKSEVSQSGAKAGKRAAMALVVLAIATGALFVIDPVDLYLWIKAIHVMAVISWMAAMLYLPRLFIYHCESEPGSVQSETFKVMERRLLRVIMNPAMMISWIAGLWMAWESGSYLSTWFHIKFAAVILLSAMHGVLAKGVRLFSVDANERSTTYWRVMNEVPAVLMIVIVIMVIVRPF
ncbi:MAG: protoporphyrinogen oxidase HemJ [Rhizobiaceae bacterium]